MSVNTPELEVHLCLLDLNGSRSCYAICHAVEAENTTQQNSAFHQCEISCFSLSYISHW